MPLSISEGVSQQGYYVLSLCELDGSRQLPIVIGSAEAQSIVLAKNGTKTGRPMTYETMVNVMRQFDLSLTSVSIDHVEDGIFFASLHVTDGFNTKSVDSRTSDAVALALAFEAPIFVEDRVLDACGVTTGNYGSRPPTLQELEDELRRCEENEDYERAALIQEQIDQLTK